jgi:hypothetical protein
MVSAPESDPFSPFSEDDKRMVIVERQEVAFFMINTVLNLWFRERDAVSEYLLAATAADVLKGIGKAKGITSHVFNKEMEKALGKKLRLAMNFFKHANTDPKLALRFAPVVTELFLIDAIQMYGKLYDSLTPLMHTFRAWFMVHRGRHVGTPEEVQKILPEGASIQDLISLSRSEFLDEVLPLFTEDDPPSADG